jgi:glycosyltransferase involved in cell wall biosynthesis
MIPSGNGGEDTFPKISIVTPTFNRAWCLEETILSLVTQGYPNLEYIMIDGGSTDGTSEILEKYQKHFAYVESEPNQGFTDGLRRGFSRATGDILGWLCSDDLLEPGTLREVGQMFASVPTLEVIFGDALFIDKSGKVTRAYKTFPFSRWILLNTANYIPQPSTFWTRSIHERVGGWDRGFAFPDPDLWLRFSELTTIRHVRRYWSRMRLYQGNMTTTQDSTALAEQRILERKYFGPRSGVRRLIARATARTARICWKAAIGCYW